MIAMTIVFEAKGSRKKELITAISGVLMLEAKYQGAPSFAYKIGENYTVNREGNLDTDDSVDQEEVITLLECLKEAGFEPAANEAEEAENAEEEVQSAEAGISNEIYVNKTAPEYGEWKEIPTVTEYSIGIPEDTMPEDKMINLKNLLKTRAVLIKHALGVDELPMEIEEGVICFNWFKGRQLTSEELSVYTGFISRLCEFARKRKRINIKEDNEVPNEKYSFRVFLLSLGYKGDDTKADRKLLLSRLSGSAAFRDGRPGTTENN